MKNTIKWIMGGIGTIAVTVISDRISDSTKDIPVLNTIVNFFKSIYEALFKVFNIEVRIWVLLVIIIGLVIFFLVISRFSADPPKPPYYTYNEDIFHDWLWKWDWIYSEDKWQVSGLTPYCANCDVELAVDTNFLRASAKCPNCKRYFDDNRNLMEYGSDVLKLIEAKVKKGNYRRNF